MYGHNAQLFVQTVRGILNEEKQLIARMQMVWFFIWNGRTGWLHVKWEIRVASCEMEDQGGFVCWEIRVASRELGYVKLI